MDKRINTKTNTMRYLDRFNRCFALLATTAFILPLCLSTNAEADIEASYQFQFDQNLIYLNGLANRTNLAAAIEEAASANDTELQATLEDSLAIVMGDNLALASMWRPSTNVLMGRIHPGLLLSNSASSNSNITGFEITLSGSSGEFMPFDNGGFIQEEYASGEYNYYPNLPSFTKETVDPDQVSSSANVLDGGKRLVVNFDQGGIQPGRATTFSVYSSLGIDLSDFLDDNTQLKVTYENLSTDEIVSDSKFLGEIGSISDFNSDLKEQQVNGTVLGALHFKLPVERFQSDIVTVNTTVPEPTGIALALAGFAGMTALRRRLR